MIGRRDCRTGHEHGRGWCLWHFGYFEPRDQSNATTLELSSCGRLPTSVVCSEAHSMRCIHKITRLELRRSGAHNLGGFLAEQSGLVDEWAALEGSTCVHSGVRVLLSIVGVVN